jgi:hypothetical protein
MAYKFRNPGPWGPGATEDLDAIDVDNNFWQSIQDITAKAAQGVGIANMVVTGSQLTVVLTDHTLLGPYQLPIVQFIFKGEWIPNYAYLGGSIVTHGGSTYFIPVNHTSEATFDPGANDGHGQNFYELLLQGAPLRLEDLVDVAIVGSVVDGDVLVYSQSMGNWTNQVLPVKFSELHDVQQSPGPNTGDLIFWDGSQFSYIHQSELTASIAGSSDVELATITTPVSNIPLEHGNALTYSLLTTTPKWVNWPIQYHQGWTGGSRTLDFADNNSIITCTSGAGTITIPTHATKALPSSYRCRIFQRDQGSRVTLAPASGVTLIVPGGRLPKTRTLGSTIEVRRQGGDVWVVDGDLAFAGTSFGLSYSLDLTYIDGEVFTCTPAGSGNISAATAPIGAKATFIFTTSGTTSYSIAFTGSFKSQGSLITGTVSGAVFVVSFIGDGTNMNEVSRSPSAPAATDLPFIDIGNVSGSFVLDLSTSTKFTMTANCTISSITWPSSSLLVRRVVEVVNSGSFTLTWPFASKWPGGIKPVQTLNGTDTYILYTNDSGTTVFGNVVGQNYS